MFVFGGSNPAASYTVNRSLRFIPANTTYLSKTLAAAGNTTTWTWSGWVKRTNVGVQHFILSAGTNPTSDAGFYFSNNDSVEFYTRTGGTLQGYISTLTKFRDPFAWYHLVFVYNAANATATDRMRIYVNGVRQTVTVNNTLPQNTTSSVNNNVTHYVGASSALGTTTIMDGYITEINFVDGQALDPSYFGKTNSGTGEWIPQRYTGSYGTNGFYLNFSDNSAATAAALGKDSSGNAINFTPTNFVLATDSVIDVPTRYDNGVAGAGNYSTFNPIFKVANNAPSSLAATIGSGGLKASISGATTSNYYFALSNITLSSGKWYCELTYSSGAGGTYFPMLGLGANQYINAGNIPGQDTYSVGYCANGNKLYNGSFTAYGTAWSASDVIGMAVDLDSAQRTVTFYRNGTSQGAINISTSTAAAYQKMVVCLTFYGVTSGSCEINFGQQGFKHTPPAGYVGINTKNMLMPTIALPGNKVSTVTYSGTGATQSIGDLTFSPDLIWIKSRNSTTGHGIYDTVRGVQKQLASELTSAETTETTGLTSFDSNGFTLGALSKLNNAAGTYVAWAWGTEASTVTNSQGSVTSQVRSNVSSGISVITGTAPASGNFTVGHGLNVVPSMFIVKDRAASVNWTIWHESLTSTAQSYLLFTTAAANTSATWLGNAAPTSSLITLGTGGGAVNASDNFVIYAFSKVSGFSDFGVYVGNGNADGPFINLGFKPAFIMIKPSSTTGDWTIVDNKRAGYNPLNYTLSPTSTAIEGSTVVVDIVANGFKVRSTDATVNTNGTTYVYAAWAESPLKYSATQP